MYSAAALGRLSPGHHCSQGSLSDSCAQFPMGWTGLCREPCACPMAIMLMHWLLPGQPSLAS